MTAMALNHADPVPPRDRSGGAGVRAMAKLTAAERQFRHAKLVRFLDENDYSKLSVREIAEMVGISQEPVRKELRAREGLRRPGRKPGVAYSQSEQAKRRAGKRPTVQRTTREPWEADQILTDWLAAHPGTHTSPEIERATGLPHSTLRDVARRLGITLAPARGRNQWTPVAGVAAVALPRDPGDMEPAGQDMDYVSKVADGSLVAIDKVTGLLWVMKPDRLL